MPKLCSFGCSPNGLSMHRFPKAEKFPERFKSWVAFVGGKLETKSDYEHYQKKVICDKHFKASDRTRNKRLSALAVPTITFDEQSREVSTSDSVVMNRSSPTCVINTELSADDRPDTVVISQPSPAYVINTDECANDRPVSAVINQLSTSHVINIDQSADVRPDSCLISPPLCSYVISTEESEEESLEQPSTSYILNTEESEEESPEQPSTSYILNTVTSRKPDSSVSRLSSSSLASKTVIVNEHNYSEASRPLRTAVQKDTKTTKPGNTFQYIMKNMRTPLQLLVNMQFQSKKKPKYRQFTVEEKILALSLYRKSPKGYLLLKKYFTLPSLKTMERLTCNVKPGYKYSFV